MNLEQIARSTGRSTALQLSANGVWERAWVLRPGERPPTAEEVWRWLDCCDDSVAFEVFFERPGGDAFLGARLTGLGPEERTEVVRAVIESGLSWSDLYQATVSLEEIASQPTGSLLTGDPVWLELGVVNAWQSVGSQVLWRTGEPPLDEATLQQALRARRHLLSPQANPLALEFAFTEPLPHWLGVPVSHPGPEGYVLDPSTVLALSGSVLEKMDER